MPLPVSAIIANRRRAIVSAFARTPFIQVQVELPDALRRLGYVESSVEASPGALGRRDPEKVVFIESRTNPDLDSSVWVASTYSDYASAYLSFLAAAYGVEGTKSDLVGYDVDHLLNRARSPLASTLIRIEATPSAANQAWGRLFERAASNPKFYANQYRERRNMSYVICAKLAGEAPPLDPSDRAGISRLSAFFATIGIDRREALDGLTSMLEFAYRFA